MKGLLKFITCGSVDDGKSTLIGHILYDAKLIYADQKRLLSLTVRSAVATVTLTIRFCLTVLWLSVSRASQLMLLIATSQPTTAVLSLPTHPVTRNIQETWL